MPGAYYNEIDPFAAATLRELMAEGVIAPGVVDERSIEDVTPDELSGFAQCHFFAGAGVWSYALRKAGWPDDRPIWTGSCPCQPFSAAGKGRGFADERHLWPAFHWLIAQCRPVCVAGEQVTGKDGDLWLDLVQADVEALGYAFGCVPLASAGFGAPNMRHRSFWLAYTSGSGREGLCGEGQERTPEYCHAHRLGNTLRDGAGPVAGDSHQSEGEAFGDDGHLPRACAASGDAGAVGRMVQPYGDGCEAGSLASEAARHGSSVDAASAAGGLADSASIGHERAGPARDRRDGSTDGSIDGDGNPGPVNGFWRDADWLYCRDPGGPRWRPVDSGSFPLAPGTPERVSTLRVSGNAINAVVAKEFIVAAREILPHAA